MPRIISLLILIITSQFISTAAFSQRFFGQYLDWTFFSNEQGKKVICYITAIPIKKHGNAQNRGEPYFIITKNKDEFAQISVATGYYYKKDTEVELSFGLQKFHLITYKSQAWTYGLEDDLEIIKVMRNSDDFTVSAVSDNNETSEDIYSLIGFNKAYSQMQEKCS